MSNNVIKSNIIKSGATVSSEMESKVIVEMMQSGTPTIDIINLLKNNLRDRLTAKQNDEIRLATSNVIQKYEPMFSKIDKHIRDMTDSLDTVFQV